MTDPHEADCAPGAPHPRETARLFGQGAAEAAFLDAHASGRLHHAWLITGPQGVGKATLAWRIARFLLTEAPAGGLFGAPEPASSLDVDPAHPVLRRMLALSEPRLFLLRRGWDDKAGRPKTVISVDEARKLKGFFNMSAADGGRRVVIVDAADELNVSAANALLKLLEEPPADTVMLLVCHQPARLLPTILSRCRRLRCAPLGAADIAAALEQAGCPPGGDPAALAALAAGSVGAALRLISLDGLELYADILAVLGQPLDRPRALKLADSMTTRANADRFALALDLFELFLARLARSGLSGPPDPAAATGEAQLMARLCPGPQAARAWAALEQDLSARVRHGAAVNLDPAALILDMVLKFHETAAKLAA